MPSTPVPAPPGEAPAEAVKPLMRGISVLRALSDADGRAAIGALARTTGLARATLDRILATLARMGYVRLTGHEAVLAPRLMELGNAYLSATRLPERLGPLAERLADELDESVSLAVPDGDGIRFVHQSTRRRAMSLTFRIGDLLPAERTAPGPLFAAGWSEEEWERWRARRAGDPEDRGFPAVPPLPPEPGSRSGSGSGRRTGHARRFEELAARARKDGWAMDDQLIEPGLIALSVPVRALHAPADARPVCVASVVSHTSRHSAASLRETLLPRLRAAVTEMAQELARPPHMPRPPRPPEEPRPPEVPLPSRADGRPEGPGLASWTAASKQELGREFIESLARGLTVPTAFGEGRDALTLSAVAEATGLARATARRALITLEHLGHVTAAPDRTFRLTSRVLSLGFPALSRTTLPQIAAPHLAELSGRVDDSASLAVLVGDDVQYTARVATRRIMNVNITTGTRFPAYATSMGRVLLAGLLADLPYDELTARLARAEPRPLTRHTVTRPAELATLLEGVRRAGYALVDEELEEGLRSIAVPVVDRTGAVVAALNVAMHTSRRDVAACLTEVLPELRATAARVEADLDVVGRFTRVPAV
ncbi:IclR family transcriptional regulator C-terminal domain-containing protein [Streptomyces sp. NPDC059255]|uniref:IclR family transcriptional regulator domain-containing protein n=1 Tax=Streptomyces sp. NPDC059255 TaxID=3346793 RepID=UPI00367E873B